MTDALGSSYIGDINEQIEFTTFLFIFFLDTVGKLQLLVWFILIYVIYHNIAHRIAILTSLVGDLISINCGLTISKPIVTLANNNQTRQIQSLRTIACLFDILANTSNEIEYVFSFPALFIITTSFFSCTTNLFLFIHEFAKPSVSTLEACFQAALVFCNIIMPLVIILSADLLVKQVMSFTTISRMLESSN